MLQSFLNGSLTGILSGFFGALVMFYALKKNYTFVPKKEKETKE